LESNAVENRYRDNDRRRTDDEWHGGRNNRAEDEHE